MKTNYYQQSAEQTIAELRSHRYGLTNPEANRRLQQNGGNLLPYGPPHTPAHDLFAQASTWGFAVLIIGIGLSLWQQDAKLALLFMILAVLVTFAGAWRERHVGALLHNLDALLPRKATVRRNDIDKVIDAHELVVGDILLIEPGTDVAADVRLIEAKSLLIDDSVLHSGHALARKFSHVLTTLTPLNKRHNLAFTGTTVVSGAGVGVVVATGAQTELGRLLGLSRATTPKQSLFQSRLARQSTYVGFVITALAVGLISIGLISDVSLRLSQTWALALAAALAPIGILISTSVVFATSSNRAKRDGLRFQAPSAIDRLGKTDVALLDDLDFLVRPVPLARQFLVGKQIYSISGVGYDPNGSVFGRGKKPISPETVKDLRLFFEAAILSSQAKLLPPDGDQPDWHVIGASNAGALVTLAAKAGYQSDDIRAKHHLLQQFPYDHSRKISSSLYEYDHRLMAFVHGRAESVLAQTKQIWDGGHTRTCTVADKKRLGDYLVQQATLGNHVVALAYRTFTAKQKTDTIEVTDTEQNLTLLGFVAIGRPIKLEVPEAIHTLLRDGVATSIFTDHTPEIASIIAKQIGLGKTVTISNPDLSQLDDNQLFEQLSLGGTVFSHITAENRLRIVDVMQRAGRCVLITGRSLRDVPAMHHAAVSLATSSAHSYVRDEADIILATGNLRTLTRGLNRSRHIVTNTANIIQGAFTDNLALVLLVLASIGLYASQHIPLALPPIMILALLALLQPLLASSLDTDALDSRPSTTALDSIGSRVFLGLIAALLGITSFLFFFVRNGLSPDYIDYASNLYLQAATVTLASLTVFSWINILFIRANHTRNLSSPKLWQNHNIFWALGISLLLLGNIVYNPVLQNVFDTRALNINDWLSIITISMLYAGIRWIVRTERKRSRRAVVELHQNIHGPNSALKI